MNIGIGLKRSWVDVTQNSTQKGADLVPSFETTPASTREEGKGTGISSAHPEHRSQTIAFDLGCADQPDGRYGQDLEPPAFIVSEPSCLPCNLGNTTEILHGCERTHTQNQRQFMPCYQ